MCLKLGEIFRYIHNTKSIPFFISIIFSRVKRAPNIIVVRTNIPRRLPSIINDLFEYSLDDDGLL